jgi:hypothetical protein
MNKRQIAEEELKRALLMMKYDSRKTLTENKDTINISEQSVGTVAAGGAAAGAALGAATAGSVGGYTALGNTAFAVGSALGVGATASMAIVGGLAGIGLVPLTYWLITKDTGSKRVQKIIQMCNTEAAKIAKLERKIDDKTIRDLSDQIYDATEGIGTDEDKLFAAFDSLSDGTASDACALVSRFNREHGDLFEWLDDDIDDSSEWDRIYRPFRNCVEDTLLSMKDEQVQASPEVKAGTTGGGKTGGVKTGGGGSYKACTGTYTQGCKSETIKKVQGCLGLVADGKFGPKTQKALAAKGFASGFTDADVDKICNKVQASPEPEVELPTPENNIDSLN